MATKSPFHEFHPASFLHAPKAIAEFIDDLTTGMPTVGGIEIERRLSPRFALSIPVEVQPLDNDFKPQGESFQVVTRDISATGVRFGDVRKSETKFFAMHLTSPAGVQMRTIVEIVFRIQRGPRNVDDIGGKFVTS